MIATTSSKMLTRSSITLSRYTMTRAFVSTQAQSIIKEQDQPFQFKNQDYHHQVAPLSSSTVYTPDQTTLSNVLDDASTFSPVVNAVFDE
ncbi:unnamed protein product [Cunninghamella echinulata]